MLDRLIVCSADGPSDHQDGRQSRAEMEDCQEIDGRPADRAPRRIHSKRVSARPGAKFAIGSTGCRAGPLKAAREGEKERERAAKRVVLVVSLGNSAPDVVAIFEFSIRRPQGYGATIPISAMSNRRSAHSFVGALGARQGQVSSVATLETCSRNGPPSTWSCCQSLGTGLELAEITPSQLCLAKQPLRGLALRASLIHSR